MRMERLTRMANRIGLHILEHLQAFYTELGCLSREHI
jgi:hypothetical protein